MYTDDPYSQLLPPHLRDWQAIDKTNPKEKIRALAEDFVSPRRQKKLLEVLHSFGNWTSENVLFIPKTVLRRRTSYDSNERIEAALNNLKKQRILSYKLIKLNIEIEFIKEEYFKKDLESSVK